VPGLAHVPLATAPPALPRWAVAAIATLGVAVLALAGAWWQSTRTATGAATAARDPAVERSVALPLPAASPPATAPAPRPAAAERSEVARTLAHAATSAPHAAPLAGASPPVATQSAPLAAAAPGRAAAEEALPTAASLAAQGVALPPLRLELHAFSERPADRFVFINGRKYVEGERLPEGTQLVSITPIGAVLSQYGQRFLLVPE
jgi:general secretion pathway protein B